MSTSLGLELYSAREGTLLRVISECDQAVAHASCPTRAAVVCAYWDGDSEDPVVCYELDQHNTIKHRHIMPEPRPGYHGSVMRWVRWAPNASFFVCGGD